MRSASSMPWPSANAASRIGTAPLSPPQMTKAARRAGAAPAAAAARRRPAGSRTRAPPRAARPSSQTSPSSAEIEIVSPSATKTTISASDESASWKTSLSALNGRADVADEQARDEDGEEARAAGDGRDAVDHAGAGEGAQRVEPGARHREPVQRHARAAGRRAIADREPDRHLHRELAHDDPGAAAGMLGELDHPDHQRDPDRVVRARLALRGSSPSGRRSRGRRAPRTSPPDRSARRRRRAGPPRSSRARST